MESPTLYCWDEISPTEFSALAKNYGTPFFLYDADAINNRIALIRELLEHQVKVFYAVKANPNLELLRAVRTLADGLDISSGGELEQAALAGFDMASISFAGPAKTTAELTTAIGKGIGCISIESLRELMESVEISKRIGIRANIVIRINPKLLNRSFGMKMGGRPVQFGIDEEASGEILEQVQANAEQLNFKGIHVYAGSQCFEVAGLVEGVENTLGIVRAIEADTGLICKTINFGGGFGVSHSEDNREIDLEVLAAELVPILRAFRDSSAVEREFIFELGRFLTANAGIYVTRVIGSKESRGKTFFMVDGGLHHHLAAAGTFGTALRSNYILQNLSRPAAPRIRCNVAGPSCNPTDLLGIDVELPRPEDGDLIGVMKSGSYGFTASPLLFLGRRTPAELVHYQGRIVLGRRPKTILDFN
ncbi:MAG: pyridoxal-dependent decarboxylase, exosortase A system-associated [Candidatus Competibacteraceae bacterium]